MAPKKSGGAGRKAGGGGGGRVLVNGGGGKAPRVRPAQMQMPESDDEVDGFAAQDDAVSLDANAKRRPAAAVLEDGLYDEGMALAVDEEDADAEPAADDGDDADADADADGGRDISKAWGKKTNLYYGTEVKGSEVEVADDTDIADQDAEAAEAERQQKQHALQMSEADYDLGMLGAAVVKQDSASAATAAAAALAAAERDAAKPKKKKQSKAMLLRDLELQGEGNADADADAAAPSTSGTAVASSSSDAKKAAAAAAAAATNTPAGKKKSKKAAAAAAAAAGETDAETNQLMQSLDGGSSASSSSAAAAGSSSGGSSNVAVERVERDLSALTQSDKLRIVMTDAPELLPILDELKAKMAEVKGFVWPVLQKVRAAQLPTSKGLSFLELKFQLLLSYCTHAVFVLLLKAEGKSIADHPVVSQLVHIRTAIDKLRPLDKKLKYQVDKLVKAANAAPEQRASGAAALNASSFKPNPKALTPKVEEKDDLAPDAVYVPPKLHAADPDASASERHARREQKKLDKARASRLVRDMTRDLHDTPDVANTVDGGDEDDNAAERRLAADEKERTSFEEEYFIRMSETKADRNKKKRKTPIDSMADLKDFDEYGAIAGLIEDDPNMPVIGKGRKEKSALSAAAAASKGRNAIRPDAGADGDDEFTEADREVYDAAAEEGRRRKKQRIADHPIPERRLEPVDPDRAITADGRRAIGKKIDKNRGLTPNRPKDRKTPRTANRAKAAKRDKQLNSQRSKFKGQEGIGYSGEKTGVKSRTVRSQKLA